MLLLILLAFLAYDYAAPWWVIAAFFAVCSLTMLPAILRGLKEKSLIRASQSLPAGRV